MNAALAGAISIIGSAVATAILYWATYRFPRGYHDRRAVKNESEDE